MVLDDTDIGPILSRIYHSKGIDFTKYRDTTLRRRISRRMTARGCPDLDTYATLLDEDPEEHDILVRDLTIKYTEFFRDDFVFQLLEQSVLPEIASRVVRTGERLAVWSAACATGEETYSVASMICRMSMFREVIDEAIIVGTDVDPSAVKLAEQGCYTKSLLPRLPGDRRENCFTDDGNHILVCPELKSMVTFDVRDLTNPSAADGARALCAGGFDLILCRNLLVYLNRNTQTEIVDLCVDMLKPDGFLVLGTRETVPRTVLPRLSVVDSGGRIYQRKSIDTGEAS